jgi:hypothetical protein
LEIEAGERAEAHIDAFIAQRDKQRRQTEGERKVEEAWAESCRVYEARRQAELVFAWVEYHEEAAERALANGEAIAARHRAQIEALLGNQNGHHSENGNGHRGEVAS